jgi:hypothetical protein
VQGASNQLMWQEILVRTGSGDFIKIVRNQDRTITTTIAESLDVPDSVKNAPAGSGETNLNAELLEDVKIIAISYHLDLTEPVEYFVTKRGSGKPASEEFSEIDTEEEF